MVLSWGQRSPPPRTLRTESLLSGMRATAEGKGSNPINQENEMKLYDSAISNIQRKIERAQGNGPDSQQLVFEAGTIIGSTRSKVKEEWLITSNNPMRSRLLQDLDNALYLCADALAKSLYVPGDYNKEAKERRTAEYLAGALFNCDLANDINSGVSS